MCFACLSACVWMLSCLTVLLGHEVVFVVDDVNAWLPDSIAGSALRRVAFIVLGPI